MPYTREVWTLASRVKGEITEDHFQIKVGVTTNMIIFLYKFYFE